MSEVCKMCRKFESNGPRYFHCCNSCWCIHQPYFSCLAIKFKDGESMPDCSEEFTFIEDRNALLYEGMGCFRSCDSYEVRSVLVGGLGSLTKDELLRVFDHVWEYGCKLEAMKGRLKP